MARDAGSIQKVGRVYYRSTMRSKIGQLCKLHRGYCTRKGEKVGGVPPAPIVSYEHARDSPL